MHIFYFNISAALSVHHKRYSGIKMTYVKSWEEFEKAAERLYLQDPMKVGFEYGF
jgi:hypothetical protein